MGIFYLLCLLKLDSELFGTVCEVVLLGCVNSITVNGCGDEHVEVAGVKSKGNNAVSAGRLGHSASLGIAHLDLYARDGVAVLIGYGYLVAVKSGSFGARCGAFFGAFSGGLVGLYGSRGGVIRAVRGLGRLLVAGNERETEDDRKSDHYNFFHRFSPCLGIIYRFIISRARANINEFFVKLHSLFFAQKSAL